MHALAGGSGYCATQLSQIGTAKHDIRKVVRIFVFLCAQVLTSIYNGLSCTHQRRIVIVRCDIRETCVTDRSHPVRAGLSRRQLLKLGTLGMAGCGLSLPRLLAAEAEAPRYGIHPSADNCI